MTLLEVQELTAAYGSMQILFDVNLTLSAGEVVALLGRNGVGKSTTLKSICKLIPYHSGNMVFEGRILNHLPAYKVARLGIGLVPEGRRCFSNLTVFQNLSVAARKGYWDFQRLTELFPRLAERRDHKSSTLSGGEQQMVAIGRALMTNPRFLILDEATEGLAPLVRQEIWAALHYLKSQTGMAILIVDKSLKEVAHLADRAVILQRGATVWDGKMTSLADPLRKQYIGV